MWGSPTGPSRKVTSPGSPGACGTELTRLPCHSLAATGEDGGSQPGGESGTFNEGRGSSSDESGIADAILRAAAEAAAEAAEDATGQVGYGSTSLSRAVQAARITAKDKFGNYAAGRLEDGTIIIDRSSGELHAEQDVIQQAGERRIVDLYSEREPCEARCKALTQDMNVTWSWRWNPPDVRDATKAAFRAAIRELFG